MVGTEVECGETQVVILDQHRSRPTLASYCKLEVSIGQWHSKDRK